MKKIISIGWNVELPEGQVFRPDAEIANSLKKIWEMYISQRVCKNFSVIITTKENGKYKPQMFTFPDAIK